MPDPATGKARLLFNSEALERSRPNLGVRKDKRFARKAAAGPGENARFEALACRSFDGLHCRTQSRRLSASILLSA
jgi:hypothetical protein